MERTYPLRAPLDPKQRMRLVAALRQGHDVGRISVSRKSIRVDFRDPLSKTDFERLLKNLIYICDTTQTEVLFEQDIRHPYREDPMPRLLARREAVRVGEGMFLFQGDFLAMHRRFNELFRKLALDKYAAVEQEYPVLWPMEIFRKTNYFKDFPQQVLLLTTLKKGFAHRKGFGQRYAADRKYDAVALSKELDSCRYGLQPAVCDTCYYALRNHSGFENRVFTTYNKVFRHESSKTGALDRLMNFSVRDIMFVGDKDFVLDTRRRLTEDLKRFLRSLRLDAGIESANDPFFGNEAIVKKVFQSSFKLKHELLARLNHSGARLAIGSINLHLDIFGKAFNIRLKDGSPAFSGCIGIGFERLVYALYCQYGHDLSRWPKELRKKLRLDR